MSELLGVIVESLCGLAELVADTAAESKRPKSTPPLDTPIPHQNRDPSIEE